MTKRRWPSKRNSPAIGLRLEFQALSVGSIRPGLNESCGVPPALVTVVAVVESPPDRSTKERPRSVRNREICRMFPAGAPPSGSLTGLIWRYSYVGATAAL